MFKIVTNARAWWPVSWNGVAEDGEIVENQIELRYVIHTQDEYALLMVEAAMLPSRVQELHDAAADEAEQAGVLSRLYAEFVQKIAVDWRGVAAENGEPLKFEPDNIRLLVNVAPGAGEAIVKGYTKCRKAEREVRAGN